MQHLQIGSTHFQVDDAVADDIRSLAATSPDAALRLARRCGSEVVTDCGAVHVPMMLMDSAPLPQPTQKPRLPPMTTATMTKIRIGDADFYVDAAAAAEIDRLRGTVAGMRVVIDALPHAQPVSDANRVSLALGDADSIRIAARSARMADEQRRLDPETPRGAYVARLQNAWRSAT